LRELKNHVERNGLLKRVGLWVFMRKCIKSRILYVVELAFKIKSASIRVFALANPYNPRPVQAPVKPIQPQNPSKADQIVKNGYKKHATPQKVPFLTINKPVA
jgi:hypothetical protein